MLKSKLEIFIHSFANFLPCKKNAQKLLDGPWIKI